MFALLIIKSRPNTRVPGGSIRRITPDCARHGAVQFSFRSELGSHKHALALAMSYWTRLTETAVCFVDKNDKVMGAPAGQPRG